MREEVVEQQLATTQTVRTCGRTSCTLARVAPGQQDNQTGAGMALNMKSLPDKAKPKVKAPADKSTGWLVGALTGIAALLGAVGIGTGEIARVLSNQPWWATATFVLVALASMLGASAGWLTEDKDWEHWLLRISVVLLFGAFCTAVVTGIKFAQESPKPAITVSLSNSHGVGVLHFEVKDSGLRDDNKMTVTVVAIKAVTPTANGTTLYTASVGPSSSGAVDQSGEVALPPPPATKVEVRASVGSLHSCSEEEKLGGTGCVVLVIPRPVGPPQLTVSWRNPRHSGAGLFVFLSARKDVGDRAALRIIDLRTHHQLLRTSWPATATGNVDKAVTAIIPSSTRRLCVVASMREPVPACPPHAKSTSALVVTAAPPH